MKTCISTYSYARLQGVDMFAKLDHVAATGFDAVEFVPFEALEGKSMLETAKAYGDYARGKGLAVANYAVGAQLIAPTGGNVDAEVERLRREIDVAEALGSPGMRHDTCFGFPEGYTGLKTYKTVLPGMAEAARRVTEYAATKGIRTMSENHGFMMQDSSRMVEFVEAVGHPNYGLLVDVGNFSCVDEDCAKAVGVTMPLAFHVHVKDMFIKPGTLLNPGKGWFMSRGGNYIRCTILGHGDIPLLQALRLVKASGYSGYVSIEFEGIEDVRSSIEIGYENLKNLIHCVTT